VSVVAPCESDVAVVEGDEATVRDGDALGVARLIDEHLLGSCERAFGVDDPFRPPQRGDMRIESRRVPASWHSFAVLQRSIDVCYSGYIDPVGTRS
jgi:hypothetical protein